VAILEAMAAGLPVISTAVGGIAEVVDDACGRLTYETEDDAVVGALVESVRELAGDAHRRRDLGACASQRVADRFSVQRMAQEITSVYEQVLG
jgi:glycosyltransferase involved in cell wall biosynthesis